MGGYDFTIFTGGPNGVVKSNSHRDALKGDQVVLKLTHSGVCGTDVHYKGAPICLGHEGVGIVQELGPEVTHLKV
jgi:threonine dehydrogenase-like Zn-dependent dehydrogenase